MGKVHVIWNEILSELRDEAKELIYHLVRQTDQS